MFTGVHLPIQAIVFISDFLFCWLIDGLQTLHVMILLLKIHTAAAVMLYLGE
jgi:hypothetical protein